MAEKPLQALIWDGYGYRPADPGSHELALSHKEGTRLSATLTVQAQVVWNGQRYMPADPMAEEQANRTFVQGAEVDAKIARAVANAHDWRRGQNALYWAGLGLLVKNFDDDNAEKWPTARHFHDAILQHFGYTYRQWKIDGTFKLEIDSIAFDKMEDPDFEVLFEKTRGVVVTLFGYDPFDAWKAEKDAERALRQASR